ncbi:LuxR C-terminal-related transcriptional regulator [Paenibacillus xylanilyticus]|uniref:LuxR C-terminal-related transcriptional regulator n=1 Tax=Paenibacillus xylanilyticus TaxID=248903 RepID=UPI00129E480F|nr:LuxR C-terminal-related transcriptional regulator [Paenibacillus xylanilyticus]
MHQEHTAGPEENWIQFMILKTKLELPPLPANTLDRPRLSSTREQLYKFKVTLLTAPAGSGKSTLLGSWVQHEQAACVCLDDKDQDSLQFWLYVIHALDRVKPDFCREILAHFLRGYSMNPRSALVLLMNHLALAEQPVLLILDDYHAVTQAEIHEQMEYFVENMPPSVHLVLSSRTSPPLKLEKLKLRGELRQVMLQDLAFTAEEGVKFCQDALKLNVTSSHVHDWVQQTEGWVAGLKLLALSYTDSTDQVRSRSANRLAPTSQDDQHHYGDRSVSEYLLEEVFHRQSPEMQHFLLSTSVVQRMNGDLCRALTDIGEAPQLLRHLEKEHLFLITMDRGAYWFRYHHMFSSFLRRELARSGTEQVNALHAKAARWYEQQGYAAEALDHYIHGQHVQDAARLLEELFAHFIMGEWWTLRRYFDVLPQEVVKARPKLYMSYLFLIARERPYGEMMKELDGLENMIQVHLQGQLPPEISSYLLQVVCVMRAYMAYLNRDLQGLSDHLISYIDQGYPDDIAFQYMDYDRRESMRLRSFHGVNGSLQRGEQCFGTITNRWFAESSYVTSYYGTGYAEIKLEQNRLSEAIHYADRALDIALQIKVAALLVPAYVLKARIETAQGRPNEGMKLLQQLCVLLSVKDLEYWQPIIQAHQYRLQLEIQPVATAQLVVDDSIIEIVNPEISCDQVFSSLVRVRAKLLLGDEEESLNELKRIRTLAEERNWLTEQVECGLLEAQILQRQGHQEECMAPLLRAIAIGSSEGYIRSFINEGEPVKSLLQHYLHLRRTHSIPDSGIKLAYVKELLSAFAKENRGGIPSVRLSPMEQRVFGYIAEGLTSKQIAAEFGISAGTVNTHIRRVFAKLGASSRAHAVQIAEQQGWL